MKIRGRSNDCEFNFPKKKEKRKTKNKMSCHTGLNGYQMEHKLLKFL